MVNHPKNFLRFCVVGGINTAVDFGVFMLLYSGAGFSVLPSHACGFITAVTGSFVMNKLWVFGEHRASRGRGQIIRFALVTLTSFLLSSAVVWSLSRYIPVFAAKLAAIAVTMISNYAGYSRFVFRR